MGDLGGDDLVENGDVVGVGELEGVRVDLVDLFDLPGHDLLHEGAIARAIYTFAVDADASDQRGSVSMHPVVRSISIIFDSSILPSIVLMAMTACMLPIRESTAPSLQSPESFLDP